MLTSRFLCKTEVSTNLFILPLDDLLLGARWLRTLGDITWNFSQLAMHFIVDGNQVTIKGKGGSTVTTVSNYHMEKILKKEIYAYLMQPRKIEGQTHATSIPLKMDTLLSELPDVSVEPQGLSPKRSHDHCVPLLLSCPPTNVRP